MFLEATHRMASVLEGKANGQKRLLHLVTRYAGPHRAQSFALPGRGRRG